MRNLLQSILQECGNALFTESAVQFVVGQARTNLTCGVLTNGGHFIETRASLVAVLMTG